MPDYTSPAMLVGKVRVNQQTSGGVQKLFSRFLNREGFDVIEIFDASHPNDPSPPSKAAAVLRRTHTPVPLMTVLDSHVFDYNNRDFQQSQLARLLDRVASTWLIEQGGGLQLTVHRPTSPVNSPTVFAKSKQVGGHKPWKSWNQSVYTISPGFCESRADVRVLGKSGLTLHACVDADIARADFAPAMNSALKAERCLRGVLYFPTTPCQEPNVQTAMTITCRPVNCDLDTSSLSIPLSPEFIRM